MSDHAHESHGHGEEQSQSSGKKFFIIGLGVFLLVLGNLGWFLPTSTLETVENCTGEKITLRNVQKKISPKEIEPGTEEKDLVVTHRNNGYNLELPNYNGITVKTYCDTVIMIGVRKDTFYFAGNQFLYGKQPTGDHNPKFQVLLPESNPRSKSFLHIIPPTKN